MADSVRDGAAQARLRAHALNSRPAVVRLEAAKGPGWVRHELSAADAGVEGDAANTDTRRGELSRARKLFVEETAILGR